MEIKFLSTEIIKPSSSTPDHLRTHKLFYPNYSANPHYPVIFFYSTKGENPIKISSHLKNSLSKTLSYYYPLAGQIKDEVSTDCKDHGVVFIETRVVVGEMSEFIEKKDNDMLKQLVPLKGNLQEFLITYGQSHLTVQVNYFNCGGIAICMCFNHDIIDGTTAAYFPKIGSEVARGANDIKNVVVDHSPIHPPLDVLESVLSLYKQNHYNPTDIVGKSFTFDSRKMAALKVKVSNGPYINHPTRFEAIASLISSTLIKIVANRIEYKTTATKHLAVVLAMNLRNKVNPRLPQQSLGNLSASAIAKFSINQKIDHNILAAKIHEYVTKAVDRYKKNTPGGGIVEGFANGVIFHITDISRLPYYEADFGWGKPLWFSYVCYHRVAFIKSASDGERVEMLIGLSNEEMEKFKQDPEILTYTQSSISKNARL